MGGDAIAMREPTLHQLIEMYARDGVRTEMSKWCNAAVLQGEADQASVHVWMNRITDGTEFELAAIAENIQTHVGGIPSLGEVPIHEGWPDNLDRGSTLYLAYGDAWRLQDPIVGLSKRALRWMTDRDARVLLSLAISRALLGLKSPEIRTVSFRRDRGAINVLVRSPVPQSSKVQSDSRQIEMSAAAALLDWKVNVRVESLDHWLVPAEDFVVA